MPKKVDEYYKQVKEKNPGYSEEQAWATAWSIYCKHKNPGSPSCKKDQSEYFKGKKAMSDDNLRKKLIRLAHAKPELRPKLLPLLKTAQTVSVGDRFKDQWGVIWVVSEPDRGGTVHAYPENRGKRFSSPVDVAELLKRYTRLASMAPRSAALRDGPIGRVLDGTWNVLHDIENGLEKAAQEYDVAASYSGGPGARDAKIIRDMAMRVKDQLEKVSMRELGKLYDLEDKFVKKFGEPDDYASAQSRDMFSR